MESKTVQTLSTHSRFVLWLKHYQLLAFFVLTYGITWGGWFLLFALQSDLLPFRLDPNSLATILLFRLSGWGPAIAAVVLTALIGGKHGLREFFSRFVRWRVGPGWYAAALFSFLVITLIVLALSPLLIGTLPGSPYMSSWYSPILLFLPGVLVATAKAALPEEPGWRGYALPRLLSRYNALLAGLLLGLIWGVWHLPIYILSADSPVNFLLLVAQSTGLSILITWVYLHTKGSILISILFHGAIDSAWVILLNDSSLVQVNVLLTGVIWAAVMIVLAIFGPHLSRQRQGARASA